MKPSPQQIEQAAKSIFKAMAAAAATKEEPKPWVPGGNSLMQEEARRTAHAVLEAIPGAPDGYLGEKPEFSIPKAVDHSTFEDRLKRIINYHSMENMGRGGNTPDYILAEMLCGTLAVFDKAMAARDRHNAA